jgi:hypothetical protein
LGTVDGVEKGSQEGGLQQKKLSISLLPIIGQKKSSEQKRGSGAAPLLVRSRSIPSNRSNGYLAAQLCAEKRTNSKKLSVVPEADEQVLCEQFWKGTQSTGRRRFEAITG